MSEVAEVTDWEGTYNAAMDSVNLINAGKPDDMSNEEWDDCLARNVDHLHIVLAKDWPDGFDLEPLQLAAG